MALHEAFSAHARALAPALQCEALDFIAFLPHHRQTNPRALGKPDTEAFIRQFAGSMGANFTAEITRKKPPSDTSRESLE